MATSESSKGEVARWRPFGDEFFWGPVARMFRGLDEPRAAGGRPSPAMDVSENEKSYTLTVELPGVKKEDVTVELQDNVLSIRGEKKSESEEKRDKSHWVERSYGSFSRSLSLPANVLSEQVKASFADGVLTIEIPKREEAKAKQISIK
jgi:HSP20 family protein